MKDVLGIEKHFLPPTNMQLSMVRSGIDIYQEFFWAFRNTPRSRIKFPHEET